MSTEFEKMHTPPERHAEIEKQQTAQRDYEDCDTKQSKPLEQQDIEQRAKLLKYVLVNMRKNAEVLCCG